MKTYRSSKRQGRGQKNNKRSRRGRGQSLRTYTMARGGIRL